MITDSLTVERDVFERATGWELKPEGACKGDVCIPLAQPPAGTTVDLEQLAEQMHLPLVHDADHGLWALGPESVGARALATAQAPELVLPDVNGQPFDLASLRGSKVVMVAWSPY